MRSSPTALAFAVICMIASMPSKAQAPFYTYAETILPPASNIIVGEPLGLAIDPATGNLISSDNISSILIFTPAGTLKRVFNSGGSSNPSDTTMAQPQGVALDPTHGDDIVVADFGNSRVQIFTIGGTYVGTITGGGTSDPNDTALENPLGVAVEPGTGNIVVADTGGIDPGHNRVQIYSNAGTYIGTITGQDGAFNYPSGVAVDPTNGDIVVTDQRNNRVQIFDSTGAFLGTLTGGQSGDPEDTAFSVPTIAAVQPVTGNIFVADYGHNRMQVFNASGRFLTSINNHGATLSSVLVGPSGIAFVPGSKNVFVSSINYVASVSQNPIFEGEIQVYGPPPPPAPALGAWALAGFALLLAGGGWLAAHRLA